MRYYIASGLENAAKVKELKKILDARGWVHTYDWTAHGAVWPQGGDALRNVAELEEAGVCEAEVVIVLLPGGRGTHAEFGMALSMAVATAQSHEQDPRIVIFSENPKDFEIGPATCAFYHHPLVERFSSMDEMIKSLLGAK